MNEPRGTGGPQRDPPHPQPQSALRRSTPSRKAAPSDRRSWLSAAGRLRERDHVLLRLLHEHGTLSGPQIQVLLFATPGSATKRLGRLRLQGWITSFRTRRGGRQLPVHWVLDNWGSRWAAFNAGEAEPTPRQVRARNERFAASSQLEHFDGTNEFFVALITASRRINTDPHRGPGWHEQTRLARWWSARHIAQVMDQRIRPDAHGVWVTPAGHEISFYLEYDRGTESLARLSAKLPAYRQIRADGLGPQWPVLIVVPTGVRERHLHQHLREETAAHEAARTAWPGAHPYQSYETLEAHREASNNAEDDLMVVTTTLERLQEHSHGPAGQVWLPLDGAQANPERISLAEMAIHASPAQAGPAIYDPGAPGPDDDPLLELDLP